MEPIWKLGSARVGVEIGRVGMHGLGHQPGSLMRRPGQPKQTIATAFFLVLKSKDRIGPYFKRLTILRTWPKA